MVASQGWLVAMLIGVPTRMSWNVLRAESMGIRTQPCVLGVGFDKAPVQTVGGLELHPIGHRIASSRTALAAAVGHLRIDGEVAVRCRRRGRADGNRRGEKNGVPFDALRLCRGYPSPLPFGGMSRVPRSTTPNLRVGRTLTRLRPPRADLPPQESF